MAMKIIFLLLHKMQLRQAHKNGLGILIMIDYFRLRVFFLSKNIDLGYFHERYFRLKYTIWKSIYRRTYPTNKNVFRKVEDG